MCTNCGKSITLPSNLTKGDDGQSIVWKGQSATFPNSPEDLWAFYHTGNNISYIYNSTSGQWEILSQDGTSPSATAVIKLLNNDSSQDTYNLSDSGITTDNKSFNFDASNEGFTDDSIIEVKGVVKMQAGGITGSPGRVVKLAIGNTANAASATVLGSYTNNNTDEIVVELTSRLNLTDVSTSSNNVVNIFEYKVQDAPANYYQRFNVGTISLDLTTDVYIFTICEITGTTVAASFTDHNQLITRIIK